MENLNSNIEKKNSKIRKDSLAGKIIAFILVIVMVGIAIISVAQASYMLNKNLYGDDVYKDLKTSALNDEAYNIFNTVVFQEYPEHEIHDPNILGGKIIKEQEGKKPITVWKNGNIKNIDQPVEEYREENIYEEDRGDGLFNYSLVLYISKDLKPGSNLYAYQKLADWLVKTEKAVYPVGIASVIIAAIALIYLLAAAGHKKPGHSSAADAPDPAPITGTFITKIPADLYTIITAIIGFIIIFISIQFINEFSYSTISFMLKTLVAVAMYLGCATISLLWLVDVTIRIKMGKWWKNTLVYKICSLAIKAIIKLAENMPLVWKTLVIYGIISILEILGILSFGWYMTGPLLAAWLMEKIILLGLIMSAALMMKKLQIAGEKIQQGDLDYQVDTSHMFWDFKKHGENLNQIGQGLNRAVDQRLKSERMKTELITNVSHDIKTPLTSIINYSDLIGKEQTDNQNIKDYAEVLNRQSDRLKRLIEDLVEASKASTGNLEVNLEPFELGVMITQTAGEYQDRFSASNLSLIVDHPQFPVMIQADGRRLWRVMDNILNNACKYAMAGTRVYLTLEKDQEKNQAVITLKNISKEQLDISPEELLERFVQGDKARKTEGNGLGLSIANSLTELQGGKLQLSIDGDLFKVTLTFQTI